MISEISKRYSRALYELAVDTGQVEKVLGELRTLSSIFESSGLVTFLSSPEISPDDKAAALKASLAGKVGELTMSTLLLIVENHRASLLPEIVHGYEQTSDEANGVTRGQVHSAEVLTSEKQKALEAAIVEVTKRKVILTYDQDASLVGGLVASVGGWTFDDSIKSHLHRMGEQLKRN